MYDIRPNEGIGGLTSLAVHYGDRVAQGIQQQGKIIEQGLQRISTTKELQGLGQVLTQLDPKTPDYTQKLIELKSAFPLAASDPRGQAMVGMGFKEHLTWQQSQDTLARARALQGINNPMVNVGGGPVGGAPLPAPMAGGLPDAASSAPDTASPLTGIATGGMSNVQPQTEEQTMVPAISDSGIIPKGLSAYNRAVLHGRTGDLQGMTGGLSDLSPMDRAKQALAGAPGGQVTRKTLESTAARIAAADATAASRVSKQTPDIDAQIQATGFTPVEGKDGIFTRPEGGEYTLKVTSGKPQFSPVKTTEEKSGMVNAPGMPGFKTNKTGSIIWDFRGETPVQVGKKQPNENDENITKTFKALKEADDTYKTEVKIVNDLQKQGAPDSTLTYHVDRTKNFEQVRDSLRTAYLHMLDISSGPKATRIIERGGKKYEVDDATKKVLREVP